MAIELNPLEYAARRKVERPPVGRFHGMGGDAAVLESRLAELLNELAPDERIATFTGATSLDRREELKRRFNSDPTSDALRILICTDAAREGINLQARCAASTLARSALVLASPQPAVQL
jgi:hypothetical protein